MKKFTLFVFITLSFSQINLANPIHDTVAMGPGYSNDVFYSLSNGVVKTETRANWDLGFYTSPWSAGIIINEGMGVQLFTYPHGDTAAWNTIDSTGFASWKSMHNSDTIWEDGAFNRNALGHPDYGWGVYNTINHDVVGDSLYIIKLPNGSTKKLWLQRKKSVQNTFYFKYADLDGSNEVIEVLDATPYQVSRMFIYYSLQNQLVVDREPDINDWDLLWGRYAAIVYDQNGNPSYYVVVGVLSNLEVGISKHQPIDPGFENWYAKPFEFYKTPIGHNWKEFNMSQFEWVIEDSLVYFVSDNQGDIYKLAFDYFGGMGNGKTGIVKKLLSLVSQPEFVAEQDIKVYPNPATDYIRVNLSGIDSPVVFRVFDLSGRMIEQHNVQSGQSIEHAVDTYNRGIYIIEIETGATVERHKLVIR